MPIVQTEWGTQYRRCESCDEEATWMAGENLFYCDYHKPHKPEWWGWRKLEKVTRMLKGEGFLVVPINIGAEEFEELEDAQAAASAIAERTGGALILATVEKIRPIYNTIGKKTDLGNALVKLIESRKRASLPRPSEEALDALDNEDEEEREVSSTLPPAHIHDTRTRCMAHCRHPAGKEVQCERPDGHRGSHFNEDFQHSPITWHDVTETHVTSSQPVPTREVGTGETGGATPVDSQPVHDMPSST